MSLQNQSSPPDNIIVISDNNSNNDTDEVALSFSDVIVFPTVDNNKKKAGGLNQWLDKYLQTISNNDLIMVMDADSILEKDFCKNAREYIEQGYSACGGVFLGKPGGGIVGMFQRNEYARYARDVERKAGATLVLTGTATIFLASALKEVVIARQNGILPCVDNEAHVYDTGALTEDNELTFALLHLGHMIIAPRECSLTTEVMPTWPKLWRQRLRWKRGAIENNKQYGLTKVTLKYWGLQIWGFIGIMVTILYLSTFAFAVATGSFNLRMIWLFVTLIYVLERCVTVRERGPLQVILAGTLVAEMSYDISLQAVHIVAFFNAIFKRNNEW